MLGTLDLLVGVASVVQRLEILEISAHAVLQLPELVHLGLCRPAIFDQFCQTPNAFSQLRQAHGKRISKPIEVLTNHFNSGLGSRGLVESLGLLLRRLLDLLDRQRLLLLQQIRVLLEIGQLSSLHRGHWTLEELSWVVTCLHEWKRLVVVHGRLHLLHLQHLLRRQMDLLHLLVDLHLLHLMHLLGLQMSICMCLICVFPIVRRRRRSGWLLLGEDGEVVGLHVMGHIPADSNDLH
jgi:hypothetical protein